MGDGNTGDGMRGPPYGQDRLANQRRNDWEGNLGPYNGDRGLGPNRNYNSNMSNGPPPGNYNDHGRGNYNDQMGQHFNNQINNNRGGGGYGGGNGGYGGGGNDYGGYGGPGGP
eukprot:CAMPEP_0170541984 /NCGR_PEP_ID=MMETSP0211-20121228/1559_1 /TAXON_ID=311385 /ORGANISM="Pseudokeronopsis sp., Strain OXSARD2" /LENGTH=112 /DNA_ID=CAMNT_0010844907 /DNA_START=782 /DNA_END=1116 /DNA_ORIENTATION=-